jgi:hypothetical protein
MSSAAVWTIEVLTLQERRLDKSKSRSCLIELLQSSEKSAQRSLDSKVCSEMEGLKNATVTAADNTLCTTVERSTTSTRQDAP